MSTQPDTLLAPSDRATDQSRPPRPLREIAAFLVIAYLGTVVVALCLPGTIADPGPAPFIALFVPALAVGVLSARRRRAGIDGALPFGLRRAGLRGWPTAVILPVLAVGVPFAIADLFGLVQIVDIGGYLANAPIELGLLTVLVLGEEIGWRGYMLPRLAQRLDPRRASLVTGFAQGVFHLPLILLTNSYDSAGNRAFVAAGAVTIITLAGAFFGWLRIRTGSLWSVAIAHAAVNVCIIEAPHLTSRNADLAAYWVGEAGILTLVCTATIAVVLCRRANWTPRTADRV